MKTLKTRLADFGLVWLGVAVWSIGWIHERMTGSEEIARVRDELAVEINTFWKLASR